MSRLDDLIDLVQTTSEVYFITAPGRVRTAFILVDDIVELSLKTFLQERALEQREQFTVALEQARIVAGRAHRNALAEYFGGDLPLNDLNQRLNLDANRVAQVKGYLAALAPADLLQHWSVNEPDTLPNYREVVRDVKQFFPPLPDGSPHPAIALLDDSSERHRTRNRFYHDHRQIGLTIDDDKCLRALCGMFDLVERLFPAWTILVQANQTVRCQIGVLRLKRAALGQRELTQPYNEALEHLRRNHRYDIESRSVEHSLVHTVSDRFFRALREQFANSTAQLDTRINRINAMLRPTADQRAELADKERLRAILQRQLDEINALLGPP